MDTKMFRDNEHWKNFTSVISRMKQSDVYHISFAYLVTLDAVTCNHISDLFDFECDCIKSDGIRHEWQTSTSRKTTRLAFNLWNDLSYDGDEFDSSSAHYSVSAIMDCGEYAPYYWEAIKLRFNI